MNKNDLDMKELEQESKPDDSVELIVFDHIKIIERETQKVILNRRG